METGPATADKVREVIVRDDVNDVTINVSSAKSFELWSLPIETWVDTPKGREKQYQSSCFVPRWRLNLKPDEVWETKVAVNLTKN